MFLGVLPSSPARKVQPVSIGHGQILLLGKRDKRAEKREMPQPSFSHVSLCVLATRKQAQLPVPESRVLFLGKAWGQAEDSGQTSYVESLKWL